jgi:transcription antitermination factor NusA-like protein
LNKKVRVIADAQSQNDLELERFIKAIIYPHDFKNIIHENTELIIFSLPRTKAALIGRNKQRIEELSKILEEFFGIKHVLIK